ncbi:MAG: 4a-hydroxytetrahydrobiopterin dehydratase [Hyphomicrobiales bacterium]
MTELTNQNCAACDRQVPALTDDQITVLLAELDTGWVYDSNTQTLTREFVFKGFAKAVYMANLVAFISDKEGHHADIQFGWGYCRVIYTSHELGRLSENDFICAAKLDAML